MDHQCRYINLGNVLAEIFMPGGHARHAGCGGCNRCHVPTRLHRLLANSLPKINVSVVEVFEKLGEERIPVGGHGFLNSIEYRTVDALRIVAGLEQIRRHPTHDYSLAHIFRAVFSNKTSDLASTHREANQRKVFQLQMADEFVQVFCKCVVVVAGRGLAGFAESPTIVSDDAISGVEQNRDLFFPGCTAEWISVNQYDGLTGSVIFIVEVDGS